jgi:hypothetical protein
VLLAACGGGLIGPDTSKAHDQANAALDQWAEAVAKLGSTPLVVPVGELTSQIGNWEVDVGDNNKQALMAGRVFTNDVLDGQAQDGEVTWPDRSVTKVPVMSAQDAIVAIGNAAQTTSCDGCTDLTAIEATLVSGEIQTTRGRATAPIWSFTIQGTDVKVTRVAIANSLIVPQLPWDPSFSSVGLHIDSALGSMTGKEVSVSFTGAPDPASKPCGEDYSAEAVESDQAVVVIVVRRGRGFTLGGCPAVGARRTATATLKDALGDRAILNVDDGQPVPMTILP